MKEKDLDQVTNILNSIIRRHELERKMKYGRKFQKWEDFGLHVLNVVYDWGLEDLNEKYKINFPGIDLGNADGIGVQVTIDNTTTHINNSIETYRSGFNINGVNILPKQYPKLKFLFISTSHSITKKYNYTEAINGFDFTNDEIITFDTLLVVIEKKTPSEIKRIKVVLEGFVEEFDDFLINLLREDNYKLAKDAIKDNIEEFKEDPIFREVIKEIYYDEHKTVGVSTFTFDFDTFSESYSYILKNIERIKIKGLTNAESKKFYKSISVNSSYIFHFFVNIGEVKFEILDEIILKLIDPILQSNKCYQNFLSIISYLELYIDTVIVNRILNIFLDILKNAEDEFIFRQVAIVLSDNKLNSFDTTLMVALIHLIVENGQRFSHDFIVKFLLKNIDKFNNYEIENLMNLFDFDGTGSDKLVTISPSVDEAGYLPKVFSKILYIDYKLTFKFFGKLLKLFYENNNYSISKSTLSEINGINHISYYSFPEVILSTKHRINNLQENVFISLGKELIKAGKTPKTRGLFIEIIKYIIEKGDYSIYFELISFALVDEKEKNIDLIRELVHKKEILPFINIFQRRWGEDIFGFLFYKEDNYIEEFENHVLENKYLKSLEYNQAYLLSTIPRSKLSKKGGQTISDFIASHEGLNISFRSEASFNSTISWGRKRSDIVKFKKKEKLESIYKKCDDILDREKGWDLYDYIGIFEEYFRNNLEQINDIYTYISSKGKEAYILASLTLSGFIKYSKERYMDSIDITFYKDLVDVYSIIKEDDTLTKLEIGRILDDNKFLGREFTAEISKIDKEVYVGVKGIVLDLANNSDPNKDSEDGLTLGLNTVRGLGTITCSILLHYYPNDEDLKTKINELSHDKMYGIQATLISKVPLFLKDNRELARSILQNYIYSRNKTIDLSLVYHCIGCLGYIENKDLYLKLLNGLLESDEKEIQGRVGEMLGYVILDGLDEQNEGYIKEYKEIFVKLVSIGIGTHDAILGFCLAIQNKIISTHTVLEKEIELIIYILDNYKETIRDEYKSVVSVLNRIFNKKNISLVYFDMFYEKEVFQKMITVSKHVGLYRSINEYLKDVLEYRGPEVVDRIKTLMKLQESSNSGVYQLYAYTYLEVLLSIMYDKYGGKNCRTCNMIFEKGLELGHKAYIEIYNEYYQEQ